MPTHQISLRAETAGQPPAELFVPAQREPLDREPLRNEPERGPDPPDPPGPKAGASRARTTRPHPVAIVAVLLSGLLGVVTIGTFPEPDRATTQNAPSVAPERPLDDIPSIDTPDIDTPGINTPGIDGIGIDVVTASPGASVSLPGPASRDWVAPGARSDGALARAELAEESIEFRAANTQPGRPGAFRIAWSGGTPLQESGEATAMLGIRPGGWVAFVVRPLSSPADLVVHLGGSDVTVTVVTELGSTHRTVSAPAAIASVALPAATAATVTVTAGGNQDVAVATAELRDTRSAR